MKILVTGCAGFIGYHTVKNLLNTSHKIIGIDNINSYYDPRLKKK
jgi:UDP-glucuronate 4-epimerase